MNLPFQAQLTRRAAWGWIILATLAAHFLLPFCTLVVSDDWFTLLAYRQHSFSAAWKGAVYLSMPLTVLQTLPFFLIGPNLFILRMINLLVLMAQGIALYSLISRLRPRAQLDALWVAVFAVTFPGYLTHFMVSFLFYQLGFLLFLCSLLLTLEAEDTQQTNRRRWLMAAAAALVFYSFHFGALLIFYCFYVLTHIYYLRTVTGESLLDLVIRYLRTRYVYLILPFWFWALRQVFGLLVPTWGAYNQPSLSLPRILEGLDGFAISYGRLVGLFLHAPILGIACAVAATIYLFGRPNLCPATSGWHDIVGGLVGVAVLFAGIIPFVLVGKYPYTGPLSPQSESAFELANHQILIVIDTRMHLFLSLAVGFLVVHFGRLGSTILKCPSFIYYGALAVLLVVSVNLTVLNYLHLQKDAILVEGARENIRFHKSLKNDGVIGVVDHIGNISTTWDSWVLFLETVWGDRAHHGVPERWVGRTANADLYFIPSTAINRLLYGGAWYPFFSPPSSDTEEATVIISPTEKASNTSDTKAVLGYYIARVLGPKKYASYVSSFTSVEVLPKANLRDLIVLPSLKIEWTTLTGSAGASSEVSSIASGSFLEAPSSNIGNLTYHCQRPLDGGGNLVSVLVPGDLPETILDSLRLIDSRERELPTTWFKGLKGNDMVTLIASLFVDSESFRLSSALPSIPDTETITAYSPSQSIGTFGRSITMLPAPYANPADLNPVVYSNAYDIDQSLYGNLLYVKDRPDQRVPVNIFKGSAYVDPSRNVFLTGSISVNNDRFSYAKIDWSDAERGSPYARLDVIDNNGTRLATLGPPPNGGTRYYQIPKDPSSSTVTIEIFPNVTQVSVLPARISIADVDKLALLKMPIRDLFP